MTGSLQHLNTTSICVSIFFFFYFLYIIRIVYQYNETYATKNFTNVTTAVLSFQRVIIPNISIRSVSTTITKPLLVRVLVIETNEKGHLRMCPICSWKRVNRTYFKCTKKNIIFIDLTTEYYGNHHLHWPYKISAQLQNWRSQVKWKFQCVVAPSILHIGKIF